ncbi:hypothetical protein CDAR_448871 [Caerostris darwini]|uniref:Uncharacterized protein n=1 Tax=Caerostris darwini TaxID=1538125 RepID=A0AAV4WAQ9_9ARAC|nr:hypothetical protein CDAR_448871 [Caerostris darwini]
MPRLMSRRKNAPQNCAPSREKKGFISSIFVPAKPPVTSTGALHFETGKAKEEKGRPRKAEELYSCPIRFTVGHHICITMVSQSESWAELEPISLSEKGSSNDYAECDEKDIVLE